MKWVNKDFDKLTKQDLIDLIGNEIQRQRSIKGTLSTAYQQLSYVAGYAKYNMLSHSKMEFPGCSEAEMREVLTQDAFDVFKERLDRHSLENMAGLRATMDMGSSGKSINWQGSGQIRRCRLQIWLDVGSATELECRMFTL